MRRQWLGVALPAVVAFGGSPVNAQAPVAARGIVNCDSLPTPPDTEELNVYLTLKVPTKYRFDGNGLAHQDTVSDEFRDFVLQAIRHSYVRPAAPLLRVYSVGDGEHPQPQGMPVVAAEAMFSLKPTGQLDQINLAESSLSPAIDRSLLDAIQRADSAGILPLPREAGTVEIHWLYVSIASGDKLPRGAQLLFRLRVPVWRTVTEPAIDRHHGIEPPSYPTALEAAGFEGTFYAEFVIAEDGRVVPSTITVAKDSVGRGNYVFNRSGNDAVLSDFVMAILPKLLVAHYIPATIAGCPVNALAEQTFTFKMAR